MRLKYLPTILCASIALACIPITAPAQVSGDASDSFVSAYSLSDRAAKLEGSNPQAALQSYRDVARILDQISSRWPSWNPAIVEFRKKRTAEAITRMSERAGRGMPSIPAEREDLTGPGVLPEPPLPNRLDGPGVLPPDIVEQEPGVSQEPPRRGARNSAPSSGDPFDEIRHRMDDLQRDLVTTKAQLSKETKEKEDLARQLAETKKSQDKAEQQQKILQTRADNAETALMKALNEGKSESDLVKKLQAESAKAKKELKDSQIEREAADEVRQQLASRLSTAQKKIATLSQERDDATKVSSESGKRIADAQKKMEAALKEKDDLSTKLTKVTAERDDAMQQVAKMKEAQKQVDKLISENTSLMSKLGEAEKQIAQFKSDGVEKEKAIADLKKEVGSVKQQLADSQKQSQTYQVQMADLKTKLDQTAQQLTQVKSDATTNAGERKKMQDENELLRNIVLRQMKEQARRDQTRKLVLDQMSKMEVKSKDLLSQINYLGQPVVKLSEKERALFKKPQIEISNTEISIAAAKPESDNAAPSEPASSEAAGAANSDAIKLAENTVPPGPGAAVEPAPSANPKQASEPAKGAPSIPAVNAAPVKEQPAMELASLKEAPPTVIKTAPSDDLPTKSEESSGSGVTSQAPPSNVPPELQPLVQEGKEHFEKAQYREAEKTYEKILAKAPNNLYALSNLGVVRFRSGKLKMAEEAFKKAIAVAPEDAFSHCTLGIVYYSQGNYDEAVNELTRALAINPKNATAHNYLGITASQKGWQEAAQKELETATSLDPNYADAHFNLAVVFATQNPPNKENARRYYQRATKLGADPDSALEALLK